MIFNYRKVNWFSTGFVQTLPMKKNENYLEGKKSKVNSPRSLFKICYLNSIICFIVLNSRGQVILAMTWLCRHDLKSHSWVGLKKDSVQSLIAARMSCPVSTADSHIDQAWMTSMTDNLLNDFSRQWPILLQCVSDCQKVILYWTLIRLVLTSTHWTLDQWHNTE